MDISIYQVLWIRRRLFIGSLLVPLLIALFVIYSLPPSFAIKSAVEIASVPIDGRLQPIEPADLVARRAIERYLPEALLKLESQGVQGSRLASLQYLKAEPAGREVILSDIAGAAEEENSRLIQRLVIDLIIQNHAVLINNYRSRLMIAAASAKRSVENLDRQLAGISEQLALLAKQAASQDQSLEVSRDNLSRLIRGKPISDNVTDEAQIRELRERIASLETVRRNDDELKSRLNTVFAELQQSREEKVRAAATADLEIGAIQGTRASLAPSRIPLVVGLRKLTLLVSAAVASVLFALFLVLIVDRAGREAVRPAAARESDALRETESPMGLRKVP